jgi:hypothetical protein
MLYGVEEYLCHDCRPKESFHRATVLISNLQIDIWINSVHVALQANPDFGRPMYL